MKMAVTWPPSQRVAICTCGGKDGIWEGRRDERVEGELALAHLHIVPWGMVIHKGQTMHLLYYCWLCCLVSLVLPVPSSTPHT